MRRKTVCSTCHSIKKRTLFAVALCAAATMPALADTYAYKVQYLESTGAQHIDTGVVPTLNTMFKGSYEYMGMANGNTAYCDMIAGCTSPRYYPVSLFNTTDLHPRHERYVLNEQQPDIEHPYLTRHTIVFNDAQHRVFVDNKYIGKFTSGFPGISYSCFLFATSVTGAPQYWSKARIYWCEFVDTSTGAVLRRFIPVVDANGKPAMFDEINEKLYYNLGTGADFKAGPRKEEPWYFVEYIESTGTQWIDTETPALAATRTDVGYRFANTTQNNVAMIGGIQSPSRYYPISLTGTDPKSERYVRAADPGSTFVLDHPAVTDHEVVFNDNRRSIYMDGVDLGTFTSPYTDSTLSAYLFAARNVNGNKADWLAKARIYHYEIYQNAGTLCAAFRPAVDANGKGVMYNGCTGKIHANRGTGDFALGRIVSPKVSLDLSSRGDLAAGLKVLAFAERPSWGTVFKLDASTAALYDAEVRSDGVYLAAKGAAAAAVVTVTGDTAANFAVGAMPPCSSVVLSGTVRLTADCDWRGLGKIVIPDGVTIDLNGHDLQTVGFTTLPDTLAIITDTSAAGSGGRLRVEVAANGLFANNSVPLMGSLRLVKEGAGLYLAELEKQQYSGGTEVAGGTLRMKFPSYIANNATGSFDNSVPAKTEVLVGANGKFDANGNNWGYHVYTLDGGVLTSSRSAVSDSGTVQSPFTLTADSVVSNKAFGLVCQGWNEIKVRLNGHTLRYDGISSSGNTFFFGHATFEGEGTLEMGSSWIRTANSAYANIGRNLTLEQPSAYAGGLWLDAPFTVSNLVMRSGDAVKGNEKITVLGRFAPLENITDNFPNVVLADGSTLDLSGCNGKAFNVISKNNRRVTFPDGGEVTLDLSQRSDLADGLLAVAWDAIPSTTTFALDDASAAGWRAVSCAEGVKIVAKGQRDIAFAEWTGAAGNGLATDPDNWTCYDFDGEEVEGAVPGAATTIRVTGTTTLPYPEGVSWGRLLLTGNVTLGADCDWRRFGVVDIQSGVTIDLNGHVLEVSAFMGSGEVTGASGTFRVDVAEGKTLTNSSLLLSGGIALAKDGKGVFVAAKQKQTYTGGTTVAAGTLKPAAYGQHCPLGAAKSVLTVNAGATFDVNGQYDYHFYRFVLAGGTLANTGAAMGTGASDHYWGSLGDITLAEDSFVNAPNCILMYGGAINLGGKTLQVTVAHGSQLYMNGMTVSNGTFRTAVSAAGGDGWLHLYGGCDFKDTTLELGTAVALYQTVPVKNLVNSYEGLYASGPGSFHVSGSFKPVGNAFHDVTLLDGATLDLTECTGAWSNRSTITHYGLHSVGAANGARIVVDITGRADLRNGDRVVEWDAAPELVHRWSLNGTYEDSVGGATAKAVGNGVTLDSSTVTTPGGAGGYVSLGSNLIPVGQGPATVELWVRVNAHSNYGKLFACGNTSSSNLMVVNGSDSAAKSFAGYMAYNGLNNSDTAWDTFGVPQFGTMEHFTGVINDATPTTGWSGVIWTRHTLDGTYVGGAAPFVAGWALDKLDQTNTAIGGAWWNQTGANATFDEVRIWKGALTHADIEANAAASCDTVLKSFRETAKFKCLQNGQLWKGRPLSDGLYLDRRGLTVFMK